MSRLRAYKDSEGHPERGIYEDPESGSKYIRIRENGRDTFKSVGSSKITQAIKMRNTREAAKAAARLGIAMEPTEAEKQAKAKAMSPSVSQAIKRYQDDGYPDKRGEPKALDAIHRIAEAKYCETLLEYFKGNTLAESLDQDALDGYRNWRRQHVRTCNGKQDGARTTDLELNTLSNALNWAVRKKLIKVNPILNRVRYHSRADARHCRDCAPSDIDELHEIAGILFSDRRSETLGWQAFYEGMSGLRTEEVLALRMDARPDEPGGLTPDGGSLCVRRADKAKNENAYVEVRPEFKKMMQAHKAWHKSRFPNSPWYFPGRGNEGEKPVSNRALTKRLALLFAVFLRFRQEEPDPKKFPTKPHLKKKITSHGLRALYVLMRRAQGASDTQIAVEINHLSGVKTLEDTYGKAPPVTGRIKTSHRWAVQNQPL